MPSIHCILVANRGEIAVRIMRTCRDMGIQTIALYSDADREALHVRTADRACYLGANAPEASYLNMDRIVELALREKADAIHPGYGFLSENPDFAQKVIDAGLIFIGPNPTAIAAMGSKSRAKEIMEAHDVPVIPGYRGADQSDAAFHRAATETGFPILLKAAAGGGGKGMRIVHDADELRPALEAARREARNAFGNDELLLEKYFPSARHIEFQIFGDHHGRVVHLLERECTIQRRYQKIIEESPSPVLDEATRKKMGRAAVQAAQAIKYDNAGTVEFIYIDPEHFYFLEVNTRLQVEHPVTEAITGMDLVALQIRCAEGAPLPIGLEEVRANGYAIECRLYAEDPQHEFLPQTGTIGRFHIPQIEGFRCDSGVVSGNAIGIHYDPLIAKLICHAPTREEALRKMSYALGQTHCLGLTTNQRFLLELMHDPRFIAGDYDTHFLDRREQPDSPEALPSEARNLALAGGLLYRWAARRHDRTVFQDLPTGWRNNHFQDQRETVRIGAQTVTLWYRDQGDGLSIRSDQQENPLRCRLLEHAPGRLRFELDDTQHHLYFAEADDDLYVHIPHFGSITLHYPRRFPEPEVDLTPGDYLAPMPGAIISIARQVGQKVAPGDTLVILSSMKMENAIVAQEAGIVEEIFVEEGEQVPVGKLLCKIKTEKPEP